MPSWLKQSTSVDVGIGPFLDETDGKTAETALTITQPDIRLKKNGGAWAQKAAAQTLSHEEAGWYEVTLDATDTNTLGVLIVAIHESGALPVWKEYMVVPAMIYDSIVAGSDRLDTNVTHVGDTAQTAGDIIADTNDIQARLPAALVSGRIDASVGAMAANVLTATAINADAITAAKIADGAIDAATFAAGAINAAAIAADAITAAKIANGAIDAATFAADVDAEILSYIVDDATRIDASALNTAAVTTVPAIVADTNELQTDWANDGRLDLILDARASQASVDTVDTVADTIKAKTDSLTFTVAGKVDANIQAVNDVDLVGDGSGTPFNV